jgi:mannitol/fructose-specific phosphotransferase system IIA component (Ntr-type)
MAPEFIGRIVMRISQWRALCFGSRILKKKPILCVFLIISPAQKPDEQIQVLALASRAAQSRHLLQSLNAAADAGEVLAIIRDWEQTQKPYG